MHTNMTFVKAFDDFESFDQAADFVHDWIKVAKHKPASVQRDLPALYTRLEKAR